MLTKANMSTRSILKGWAIALLPATLAGQTIVPEFLQFADTTRVPYSYNGLLYVGDAIGSASMVGEGVIATAAHVIYNDVDFAWVPTGTIRFYPRYHKTTPFSPTGTTYQPVGYMRWTSYSDRVEEDDNGPGLSSLDTFNIDFAVGYFSAGTSQAFFQEYPEVHVDLEESVGVLRQDRDKMIVGYPADPEYINGGQRGLLHATDPDNYFGLWGGLESREDTWRDSENYWTATYDFVGVTTYGGNSGGPMYFMDDEGEWVFSGIVVGSNGSNGMLIRSVDENAWNLIAEAMTTRGTHTMQRVENLTASVAGGPVVNLQWTDRSQSEDGYLLYRLDDGLWEQIGTLPADSISFKDTSVLPGKAYRYTIQPFGNDDRRRPKSASVQVQTPGNNSAIGEHLNQPELTFSTSGDANWYVDSSNTLRSGQIYSNSTSSLSLELIGPGTLSFEWSASSEVNEEYDDLTSPNQGVIYDAVHLLVNGTAAFDGGARVFLSGEEPAVQQSVVLSEGAHTIEWVYEKDPYSSEGEDAAALHNLTWTPSPSNAYPVYGAFAYAGSPWHGSTWFGAYSVDRYPWVGHLNFGWIYFRPGDGRNLSFYSSAPGLGDLYTSPDLYPYIYNYSRAAWTMYVPGSGQFGTGIWFYDLNMGDYFRVN